MKSRAGLWSCLSPNAERKTREHSQAHRGGRLPRMPAQAQGGDVRYIGNIIEAIRIGFRQADANTCATAASRVRWVPIVAKLSVPCVMCGRRISVGDHVQYSPQLRRTRCASGDKPVEGAWDSKRVPPKETVE